MSSCGQNNKSIYEDVDKLAPIVLFVYNRLDETKETIEALKNNLLSSESTLFIFSDGPSCEKDAKAVEEVRACIHNLSGFKNIHINEFNSNCGLEHSIIFGVTEVLKAHDKVIVMEDDLATSPYFLKYMNDALACYENEEKVASICGYSVPIKKNCPEVYFLPGTFWWGWGTWKDRWELFNQDGKFLMAELKKRKMMKEYNINGSFIISPQKILEKHLKGKAQSWAVRWHASMVLANKFSLYSAKSLVKNTGIGNGVNCRVKTNYFDSGLAQEPVKIDLCPIKTEAHIIRQVKLFYLKAHINLLYKFIRKTLLAKF
jgi:hypothetical protein